MTTSPESPPDAPSAARPARQRWRLIVALPAATGTGEAAGGGRSWTAIIAASGLPAARDGAGRGRIVTASPLPLGIAGEREVVDVYLAERLPVADVRDAVAAALPPGWSLVDLYDVWVGAQAAPAAVVAADYRVVVAGAPRWALEGAVLAILGAAALPRERRREKKPAVYDLRPLVLRLAVRQGDAAGVTLVMRLRHGADGVGRPEEVVAALGEPPSAPLSPALEVRSVVRERLLLADDREAAANA